MPIVRTAQRIESPIERVLPTGPRSWWAEIAVTQASSHFRQTRFMPSRTLRRTFSTRGSSNTRSFSSRIARVVSSLSSGSTIRPEQTEEASLQASDHHLRSGGLLARLGREPFEQLSVGRRVRLGVLLHLGVDDHSTRPRRTHPLWPPSPIAFESATSSFASRASFG